MYPKKAIILNSFKYLILISITIIFSISVNHFFGHRGLMPLDDLQNFNSGYRVLNGDFPFRDYYSISGPLLDIFQSFFYKWLGINWDTFILHSSLFNCLYSLSIFHLLKHYNFSNKLSLLYSLCSALLMSPTAGNPTVEHHSLILSIISLILFIISERKKYNFLFFLIPIVLVIAFFIKQVPSAYFIILLSLIYFLQIFRDIRIKDFLFVLSIGLLFLCFVLFLFIKNNVQIQSILEQYIFISLSLGENRFAQINFETVNDVFKKLLFLFFCIVPLMIHFSKKIKDYDFLITSLGLFIIIIFYELHSMNQLITFALLPIFIFFTHKKILEKSSNKYIKIFFIIIITYAFYRILRFESFYFIFFLIFFAFVSIASYKNKLKIDHLIITYLIITTLLYFEKYIKLRQWDDIVFDKNKIFKGEIIHPKFKNLKWQTVYFEDTNDEKEFILGMKKFLQDLKNTNYLYITDYQLFNVLLNKKDLSPVKYWHYNTSFPGKSHPRRNKFESFFKSKLKKDKTSLIISDRTAISDKMIYEFSWIKNCALTEQTDLKIGNKSIILIKIDLQCI